MRRQNRRTNSGMAVLILAAVLYLVGCGTDPNTVGTDKSEAPGGLSREEMGLLCYYRDERDENFDADMEIVEGRIDALTDGQYLREETELETENGPRYAVNFYVPREAYGGYSLLDFSRLYISRPMNLWLSNDVSNNRMNSYEENIELPRDAMESVEIVEGCPDNFNPLDYGMEQGNFISLKIILTEEYCRNHPQIWDWQHPVVRQDIEEYVQTAPVSLMPDTENRCFISVNQDDQKGFYRSLYQSVCYSYTHEPLSKWFYVYALPVIEWESGEEIKGAGQIENSEFRTATIVNIYAPRETYVSDKNWDQTLQAIRERLDATGFSYALGHRTGDDRSVAIRMEDGLFARNFMGTVVQNTMISFNTLGEEILELPSGVKATSEVDQYKAHSKVLALDMSALRKETFYRLSQNCVKAGGGRIVLRVNGSAAAYGVCDRVISDGRFVMTYNAYTAENGFEGQMEWMPDFLESLINGTPIPTISSSMAAVTLDNTGRVYLSNEGCIRMPSDEDGIPREKLYAVLKNKIGNMENVQVGISSFGRLRIQFTMPEGGAWKEQIAETLIMVIKALKEDLYTYTMSIDFVDNDGNPVINFSSTTGTILNDRRLDISMSYNAPVMEEDGEEIRALLNEDETIAHFVSLKESGG